MYDGPYCSERMGPNYGAGFTAAEEREYWGDPSNGDYDPEHIATVHQDLRDQSLIAQNERLQRERDALYHLLTDEQKDEYYDGP